LKKRGRIAESARSKNMPPQDDFEKKSDFEKKIITLGVDGHRAQLYQLLDANGNAVGKIRDAVTAGSKNVYASEVIQLLNAKPNTVFNYEIHAYFGPAAQNCTAGPFSPFIQSGGTITTNQQGKGFLKVTVGEPGNPASKNPIPIPPEVTGAIIGFRYWVKAQDGSVKYSTECKLVYEPTPGGPHGGPGFE